MKNILIAAVSIIAVAGSLGSAQAANRDNISIVGSSTVYPFATVVAERFGRSANDFKAPKIEATGTGGGLKLFCRGVGTDTPDIANASRRIKQSEYDDCKSNGVTEILEVLVGYDGIAIANSRAVPQFTLTLKDVFLALAKDIPGPDGKLIPNPNKTWKDVDPALPESKIEVLGPPPTSGTRDAFAELAMGGGGKAIPSLQALAELLPEQADQIKAAMATLGIPASVYDSLQIKSGKPPKGEDVFNAVAYALREDGAFIEAGENDNLIVQKLVANANALGIFGYSFLEENRDQVQGSSIDGIAPDIESIASGKYPISRPTFFYVKGAHVGKIPGIQEFAIEFTSNKAIGEDGYLTDKGLIPLDEDKLKQVQADVKNLKWLQL